MKFENHSLLISIDAFLDEKMQNVREQQVLIDKEVAVILEISLEQLQQKIRDNINRFPEEFMFALNKKEIIKIFPQGIKRKKIYAFTWGGLMMLAGLINTKRAINIHLQLIRSYGKGIIDRFNFADEDI
ncbi:MAG: ORF6N domain-containing protein [Bacteroidia bacterium]